MHVSVQSPLVRAEGRASSRSDSGSAVRCMQSTDGDDNDDDHGVLKQSSRQLLWRRHATRPAGYPCWRSARSKEDGAARPTEMPAVRARNASLCVLSHRVESRCKKFRFFRRLPGLVRRGPIRSSGFLGIDKKMMKKWPEFFVNQSSLPPDPSRSKCRPV